MIAAGGGVTPRLWPSEAPSSVAFSESTIVGKPTTAVEAADFFTAVNMASSTASETPLAFRFLIGFAGDNWKFVWLRPISAMISASWNCHFTICKTELLSRAVGSSARSCTGASQEGPKQRTSKVFKQRIMIFQTRLFRSNSL